MLNHEKKDLQIIAKIRHFINKHNLEEINYCSSRFYGKIYPAYDLKQRMPLSCRKRTVSIIKRNNGKVPLSFLLSELPSLFRSSKQTRIL